MVIKSCPLLVKDTETCVGSSLASYFVLFSLISLVSFYFVDFVSFRFVFVDFVSFRFRWFRFVSFLFRFALYRYPPIYWLAEFGDVSCLQFNYLRVETLTPIWEDLVGHLSDNLVGHLSDNLVGHLSDNLVGHLSVWSPTKLSVRPECLIVDTLGGICS